MTKKPDAVSGFFCFLRSGHLFRGQPIGKLRINAARAATRFVLLPIVLRFLGVDPSVEVEVVINNTLVDMMSSGFDAGIRFGESASDMIVVPIGPRSPLRRRRNLSMGVHVRRNRGRGRDRGPGAAYAG
jgi:DNA-binding transcriptional LysR family regulator